MADPARDEAMKQRIITHMNKDHHESLQIYLQHQHQLDRATAEKAKLVDINLKQVIIIAAGKCYTLPIDPPMASLKEARERLVKMDHDARKALGLPIDSHGGASTTVTRYVPPTGFDLVVFVTVAATFIVFSRQENLRPGSVLYDRGLKHSPAFAEFCQRIQFWLFSGMIAIHGSEATYMGFVKLPQHGVVLGTSLWWKWVGTCFLEGVFSYMRLNRLIKQTSGKQSPSLNGKTH